MQKNAEKKASIISREKMSCDRTHIHIHRQIDISLSYAIGYGLWELFRLDILQFSK